MSGLDSIVYLRAQRQFQARCDCRAHKEVGHTACRKAMQAYAGARLGSGSPLGFLMMWLESQHEYLTRWAHVHDSIDDDAPERTRARNRLALLPNYDHLMSFEAGGGIEPAIFLPPSRFS